MTAEMKLRQLESRSDDAGDEEAEESGKSEDSGVGRLECAIAYPGTKIRIGSESLRLHNVERRCVITIVNDEIVVM